MFYNVLQPLNPMRTTLIFLTIVLLNEIQAQNIVTRPVKANPANKELVAFSSWKLLEATLVRYWVQYEKTEIKNKEVILELLEQYKEHEERRQKEENPEPDEGNDADED